MFYSTDKAPACLLQDTPYENETLDEAVCFSTNCILPANSVYTDAKPREVAIAACFLMLIIGIGLYPKMATQMYDAKTVALNSQVRQSYTFAKANPQLFAKGFFLPRIPESEVLSVSGVFK